MLRYQEFKTMEASAAADFETKDKGQKTLNGSE
jgi:hypothetical protein